MPKFGFNKFAKATLLKSNFGMGVRSRAYLLHIYETCFPNNTSGGLFLTISYLSLDFPVTHFILLLSFHTPWIHRRNSSFWMFLGSIEKKPVE